MTVVVAEQDRLNYNLFFDIGDVFDSNLNRLHRTQMTPTIEIELIDWPPIPFRFLITPLWIQVGNDQVWVGTAGGVGGRFYFKRKTDLGPFVDIASSLSFNTPTFPDNGSHVNFFSQGGFGVVVKRGIVALKVVHYSNGGLADNNLGWNAVVLSLGYRIGRRSSDN